MVNYTKEFVENAEVVKRSRLEWLIQSFRSAIKRDPKGKYNQERVEAMTRLERDLSALDKGK